MKIHLIIYQQYTENTFLSGIFLRSVFDVKSDKYKLLLGLETESKVIVQMRLM